MFASHEKRYLKIPVCDVRHEEWEIFRKRFRTQSFHGNLTARGGLTPKVTEDKKKLFKLTLFLPGWKLLKVSYRIKIDRTLNDQLSDRTKVDQQETNCLSLNPRIFQTHGKIQMHLHPCVHKSNTSSPLKSSFYVPLIFYLLEKFQSCVFDCLQFVPKTSFLS